jgi:hypothetical protein
MQTAQRKENTYITYYILMMLPFERDETMLKNFSDMSVVLIQEGQTYHKRQVLFPVIINLADS